MRIGYCGTDLVDNVLRTVAEERLVLCVTRARRRARHLRAADIVKTMRWSALV